MSEAIREHLFTDPTPEEIAERCAEIRKEWPPERLEKASRPVEIMVCRVVDTDKAEQAGN